MLVSLNKCVDAVRPRQMSFDGTLLGLVLPVVLVPIFEAKLMVVEECCQLSVHSWVALPGVLLLLVTVM